MSKLVWKKRSHSLIYLKNELRSRTADFLGGGANAQADAEEKIREFHEKISELTVKLYYGITSPILSPVSNIRAVMFLSATLEILEK